MSQTNVNNILPSKEEVLLNMIKNMQSSYVIVQDMENLYNKCVQDKIIKKEGNFEVFVSEYRSICQECTRPEKINEMKQRIKDLTDSWFNKLLPGLEPKNFFEEKVVEIIKILEKCRGSSKLCFSTNAASEISSLEYFKEQLSYRVNKKELKQYPSISQFPSISPISPYNLEEDTELQDSFNEAMSKSQDLAEQFQKFKDLWFLIRLLSIIFEILRVDQSCKESSYIYHVQYLSFILSNMKNNE